MVGVPLILPVPSIPIPFGNPVADQLYGVRPPDADRVKPAYAAPTVATGTEDGAPNVRMPMALMLLDEPAEMDTWVVVPVVPAAAVKATE